MPETEHPPETCLEQRRVFNRRFQEARQAGLTRLESRLFAEAAELDVGTLRDLVRLGCPAGQIAKILL